MINYDQLVKWSDDILFYKADSLDTYRTGNETDRKVLAANDQTFFKNILDNSPAWLPLYMNGKPDQTKLPCMEHLAPLMANKQCRGPN